MITQLQKWGNSLAVRIPSGLAKSLNLKQDSPMEIREEAGNIILAPLQKPVYSLESLLSQVTPENLHSETDTGYAQGIEVW